MNRVLIQFRALALALISSTALLAACGGGGDSPAAPPASTTVDVPTRVIDGPIANALVCLDKNDNGACDAGEPSARTAADGTATLKVDPADAGKFTLLALVDTSATDSGSAIAAPFTLRTPADQAALISPLTTLVATQAAATGLSSTEAAKAVQDGAGMTFAPFADYTTGSDDAARSAASLARFLAIAAQEAGKVLQSAVGSMDSSGATIAQADLDRAIASRLIELLPVAIAQGAADPAATAGALQAAAQAFVASELALSTGNVGTVVGNAKALDKSAYVPTGGASLAWFTFADAGNWYFRVFQSTLAQDTPDANGKVHYTESRKQAVAGAVSVWGETPSYTRSDVYWTGASWFACPTDFVHTQTTRDAQGTSRSLYCDSYDSVNRRSVVDISGKPMVDVVASIRAYPLASTEGPFPSWGPDPASGVLGSTVFPAGSTLRYQTTTPVASPDGYTATSIVGIYSADITTATPAGCAGSAQTTVEATTLEAVIAANPGTPCIYAANAATGPRNEWWSNGTLSVGDVDGPASALPFYNATRALRVAFGSGNTTRYFDCARRASNGSVRNCDPIGTGTYSIETVGDARVLRLANVPAQAAPLNYSRLFVERGGKVFYGFHSKLTPNNTVRLNAPAIDALFAQLGISR